jgi:hypothetical protein
LELGDGSFSVAVLGDSRLQFHSWVLSSAIESGDEMLRVAETLEAAEFVLRLTQRGSDPAKKHRAHVSTVARFGRRNPKRTVVTLRWNPEGRR